MEEQDDTVYFSVCDNGIGFSEETLKRVKKTPLTMRQDGGTGIYNVNQRLITLLGESSGLNIENLEGGGSKVSFRIPNKVSKIKEVVRSEEHTSELQSRGHLVCRRLIEKKK